MRSTTVAGVASLWVAALGCSEPSDRPPVSQDAAPWGDSVRLIEELRLGQLSGEGPEVFSEIVGVVVDNEGGIWIADQHSNEIRHFLAHGEYDGFVGGSGEGPGEFSRLLGLVRFSDGRVGGWDFLGRSLEVFRGFSHEASIRLPRASPVLSEPQLHVDRDDFIYVRSDPRENGAYWLRHDERGRLLDSLRIPPPEPEGSFLQRGQLYPFGPMPTYPAVTKSYLSPSGYLVIARSDEYRFELGRGERRVYTVDWDPVRVQPAERADFQAIADHHSAQQGLDRVEIADSKPPWWHFWVDEEDRVWIARHGRGFFEASSGAVDGSNLPPWARGMTLAPSADWWEPLTLDVLQEDRGYLGTVTFPTHRTSLQAARGRRLWVVEEGVGGEHYVVRYRIESLE